jgi:hypothetical protein
MTRRVLLRAPAHPATTSSPGEDVLTIWTIYHNPADHPGKYVVRAYDCTASGSHARPDGAVCDTLEQARTRVPCGLYWMNRNPVDDRTIVETWL